MLHVALQIWLLIFFLSSLFPFFRSHFNFGGAVTESESDFEVKTAMATSAAPANNPFSFGPAVVKTSSVDSPPVVTPPAYVTSSKESVNRIAELLKRLQVAEDSITTNEIDDCYKSRKGSSSSSAITDEEDKSLCKEILKEVNGMRQRTLIQIPIRHRQRLQEQISSQNQEPMLEFPLLFGRCFNLSMNLKILGQNCAGSMDQVSATRILSDLEYIDVSLQERLSRRDDLKSDKLVDSLMTDLKLERSLAGRPRLGFL